jgi:hypothetical protein
MSADFPPLPAGIRAVNRAAAACTIAAKNYLSHARVLARSFARHNAGIPFFTLLADDVEECFDSALEPFTMLRRSELDIPHLERFRFQYAQQPVSYAAAPYLLHHLLAPGFERVILRPVTWENVGPARAVFDRFRCS